MSSRQAHPARLLTGRQHTFGEVPLRVALVLLPGQGPAQFGVQPSHHLGLGWSERCVAAPVRRVVPIGIQPEDCREPLPQQLIICPSRRHRDQVDAFRGQDGRPPPRHRRAVAAPPELGRHALQVPPRREILGLPTRRLTLLVTWAGLIVWPLADGIVTAHLDGLDETLPPVRVSQLDLLLPHGRQLAAHVPGRDHDVNLGTGQRAGDPHDVVLGGGEQHLVGDQSGLPERQ